MLLAAGKFYVLNPDHGHQPPVLLLESNIHTAVMCVRISLDSKWLAVQMSSTQIGLFVSLSCTHAPVLWCRRVVCGGCLFVCVASFPSFH